MEEGSFYVTRNEGVRLVFSLGQTSKDLALMEEIKNYLSSLIENDKVNTQDYTETVVNLHHRKTNYTTLIVITHKDYIKNILIPFFDSML